MPEQLGFVAAPPPASDTPHLPQDPPAPPPPAPPGPPRPSVVPRPRLSGPPRPGTGKLGSVPPPPPPQETVAAIPQAKLPTDAFLAGLPPAPVDPVVPAPPAPPIEELPVSSEELTPLAAMRVISIETEPFSNLERAVQSFVPGAPPVTPPEAEADDAPAPVSRIVAPSASDADEPDPPTPPTQNSPRGAPAPGIGTEADPGWTPLPGQPFAGLAAPQITIPNVPAIVPAVTSIPSGDIEELADDDIKPDSEPPPPARLLAGQSSPPKPPPLSHPHTTGHGSNPPPPPAKAPTHPDIEVDVETDAPPISMSAIASIEDAPPRPPPSRAPTPPPIGSLSSPPSPPPLNIPPPPPVSLPHSSPAHSPPPPPVHAAPPPPPPPPPVHVAPPPPPPAAQAKSPEKPPRSTPDKKRGRPWWEEMFDDDFLRSIKQPTARQIQTEVNFIDDRLGLQKGAVILDLACGNGRHAIELTRRNYKVVGFDLSLAMLARAADEAEAASQKINFLHGDMREMTFESMFDGVYCWGMSFGYFEEEKNFAVIQRIHRALRPGGVLLLDLCNRDYIAPRQPNMVWFEGEGCICMDETNLDFITSRLKVKRTVMLDDGKTRELDFSIRLYGLNELGKLLHEAGFRVLEISGQVATPGIFFGSDSPNCIILAERSLPRRVATRCCPEQGVGPIKPRHRAGLTQGAILLEKSTALFQPGAQALAALAQR